MTTTTTTTHSFDDIIAQLQAEISSVETQIAGLQNRIHEVQMATELKKNEERKRAAADIQDYQAPHLKIDSSNIEVNCTQDEIKTILQSMYQ